MTFTAIALSTAVFKELACAYCAKVELKESSVARIILEEDNLEEWRRRQIEDSTISMFLRGKELGERPCWQVVKQDVSAKIYWTYWDALVLKERVLFKKWESPNFV